MNLNTLFCVPLCPFEIRVFTFLLPPVEPGASHTVTVSETERAWHL
jgi:hypothetical protein